LVDACAVVRSQENQEEFEGVAIGRESVRAQIALCFKVVGEEPLDEGGEILGFHSGDKAQE
jgi:hypothetical protein